MYSQEKMSSVHTSKSSKSACTQNKKGSYHRVTFPLYIVFPVWCVDLFRNRPVSLAWNYPEDFFDHSPQFHRPGPLSLLRQTLDAPPWLAWRRRCAPHIWGRWISRPEVGVRAWRICWAQSHGVLGSAPPGWRRPSRGSFPPVPKNKELFKLQGWDSPSLLTQFC